MIAAWIAFSLISQNINGQESSYNRITVAQAQTVGPQPLGSNGLNSLNQIEFPLDKIIREFNSRINLEQVKDRIPVPAGYAVPNEYKSQLTLTRNGNTDAMALGKEAAAVAIQLLIVFFDIFIMILRGLMSLTQKSQV